MEDLSEADIENVRKRNKVPPCLRCAQIGALLSKLKNILGYVEYLNVYSDGLHIFPNM